MRFNYYETQWLVEEQTKHVQEQTRLSQAAQGIIKSLGWRQAALVKNLVSMWNYKVGEPPSCAKLNTCGM